MGNLTASIQSAALKTEMGTADPGIRLCGNDARVEKLFLFCQLSHPTLKALNTYLRIKRRAFHSAFAQLHNYSVYEWIRLYLRWLLVRTCAV